MLFNADYLSFIQSSFWQAESDGKSENLDKFKKKKSAKLLVGCWYQFVMSSIHVHSCAQSVWCWRTWSPAKHTRQILYCHLILQIQPLKEICSEKCWYLGVHCKVPNNINFKSPTTETSWTLAKGLNFSATMTLFWAAGQLLNRLCGHQWQSF